MKGLVQRNTHELHQAKRGLMVILKKFVRFISAFNYYEGINWFCANTFENKMLQYFKEASESHVGYFRLWRHILRHLRHLLAVCCKSHKPPFRLAQLTCEIWKPCLSRFISYDQGLSFWKVGHTSRSRSLGQKIWYDVKCLVTRNTHLKYESRIWCGS